MSEVAFDRANEQEGALPRQVRERLARVYGELARIERKLALRLPVEYRYEGDQEWLRREGLTRLTDLYYGLSGHVTLGVASPPGGGGSYSTITLAYLAQAEEFLTGVRLPPIASAEQGHLFAASDLELLDEPPSSAELVHTGPVLLTRFLWRPESLEICPRAVW